MKKHLLIIIISLLLVTGITRAQDPHFSQYFASPLTLNPATTGFFDGDYRFAINEREQWWNVGPGYNTMSISADVKILKEQLPDFDTFAIGINGVFDKSLNNALQSNYISVSSAYHKSIAYNGSQMLAVGFQVTFANRYLDFSRLTFSSQFNTDFFDTTIPVNIAANSSATKYIEVNVGILYSVHLEKSNIYTGVSLYHANKPSESLFNSTGNKIPFRSTLHSGTDIYLSPQSSFLFSGIYMQQAGFKDKLAGCAYGLKATGIQNTDIKLYLGFWYRFNDAYIPYVGIDYNSFSAGINYSMPQSSISSYSPRTVEVSLLYKHKSKYNQSNICPRF